MGGGRLTNAPALSVLLLTPDRYQLVRKTISFLAAQTRSSSLEVVIASPTELPDAEDDQWLKFHRVKFVYTGAFVSPGSARALACAQCEAPVISFGEDHCFPDPLWAETLIRLHAENWAAVAPALGNANPGAVSWADFVLNHGSYADPATVGPVTEAPWHNTSYRRDLLLEYGERLAEMLEAEVALQQDLIRRGYRIYLAGDTIASHVNLSRWSSFLACQIAGGRLYGAARARSGGWRGFRRWFRAASLPLIPLVRAPKVLGDARRTMREWTGLPFLLACACGLAASAIGEVTGYALGAGGAGKARLPYEFERARHLRMRDRLLLP